MFEFTIKEAEFLNEFKAKISDYINKSYKFTMSYLASPIVCDFRDNERLILISINKSVYQNLYSFMHLNDNNMQYAAFACLENALYAMRLYYALATSPDNMHTYITTSDFSLKEFESREEKEEKEYSETEEQFSIKAFGESLHLFNTFEMKSPSISSQKPVFGAFLRQGAQRRASERGEEKPRGNLPVAQQTRKNVLQRRTRRGTRGLRGGAVRNV